MKSKIYLLASAILLAQLSYGQITNPAPYCAAEYDDMGGTVPVPHYISNVTFGTLNNTSGDTQYAAPHYVYYSSVVAPGLIAGHTYNLSVAHDSSVSIHYVAAYIDYNHDSSFDGAGERILQQTIAAQTITNPSTVSVTIPANVTSGITRMRVMVFEDDTYAGPDATPCTADATGYLDWGETEDYNVNLMAPTGISEVNRNSDLILYPNPAKNVVYVDKIFSGAEITITDIQGKTVQQTRIADNHIDISQLTSGLYFVRMVNINNGIVNTQKLVVGE